MSTFYDNYIKLCVAHDKSPTAVSKKIGLSNAAASGWKNGKKPSAVTKQKLADYFGVTVEELMGEEQKEKPAPSEGSELDEDVKVKAYTILDKLSKLPTKQQEAFLNSLDISIDAALNMMGGNGNG